MYNHLNLPRTVLNRGQRRSLEYTYDATGVKPMSKYYKAELDAIKRIK